MNALRQLGSVAIRPVRVPGGGVLAFFIVLVGILVYRASYPTSSALTALTTGATGTSGGGRAMPPTGLVPRTNYARPYWLTEAPRPPEDHLVSVVLMSAFRPENVKEIVRMALDRPDIFGEVIVFNSNP